MFSCFCKWCMIIWTFYFYLLCSFIIRELGHFLSRHLYRKHKIVLYSNVCFLLSYIDQVLASLWSQLVRDTSHVKHSSRFCCFFPLAWHLPCVPAAVHKHVVSPLILTSWHCIVLPLWSLPAKYSTLTNLMFSGNIQTLNVAVSENFLPVLFKFSEWLQCLTFFWFSNVSCSATCVKAALFLSERWQNNQTGCQLIHLLTQQIHSLALASTSSFQACFMEYVRLYTVHVLNVCEYVCMGPYAAVLDRNCALGYVNEALLVL